MIPARTSSKTTLLRWQGTVEGHKLESLELLTDDENGLLLERTVAYRPFPALKILRNRLMALSAGQAAGRLVGLSGGNRKVIRSATLAAAQFDVRVGDLHERKSLLPAPRPSPGRPICRSCTRSWRPCRRSSAWPPTTAATPTSTVGAIP